MADLDLDLNLDELERTADMLFGAPVQTGGEHPNDTILAESLSAAIGLLADLPRLITEADRRVEEAEDGASKYKATYGRKALELQVKRAAEVAAARRSHIANLDTPERRKGEMLRCAKDTAYWFKWYALTADPRPDAPLYTVPFVPFPFQVEALKWLEGLVFDKQTDGHLEKSRDVGASWLLTAFAVKQWLFAPKSNPFFALFVSRKESFVDNQGDLDSLFEKMRFVVNHIPSFMLPTGYDPKRHSNYMKLLNPYTGSFLKGESSNESVGRGGRQTMIVFDEFAFFPSGGFNAWTSSSESTRCRLAVSTPAGRLNKFAQLRFSDQCQRLSLSWRQHPFKDDTWFEWQKSRMNSAEIAQELELDYSGSLVGRLFPAWDEGIHVISQSEFCKFFELEKFAIPRHWARGVSHDVGTVVDHPAVLLWTAVASEDSKLPGTVFVYRELVVPEGGHPGIIAPMVKEVMDRSGDWESLALSLISHEANSERLLYAQHYGLHFESWDTKAGYNQGIPQVQAYLEPNKGMAHPFHPTVTGCPKLFVVVADGQVGQARDNDGIARLRMEMPLYHIPQSEEGKPVHAQRPYKKFDDSIDCLRAQAAQLWPPLVELTKEQRVQKRLPAHFKDGTVKPHVGMIAAYGDLRKKIEREEAENDQGVFYNGAGLSWMRGGRN